jgi:hypothetical protein
MSDSEFSTRPAAIAGMGADLIVAAHQPNFFPWLGYFDKIARADAFIVLDNVQFPKTGGTWINRVRLAARGEPMWVTMPVRRAYHGVRTIRDMEIDDSVPWRKKLLQTLRTNYAPAPHFNAVFPEIERLVAFASASVLEFNLQVIHALCAWLSLDTKKLVLASTLPTQGHATDLLIELVKGIGGSTYLSGDGAGGYQEDEKFADAGLRLARQQFAQPVYEQGVHPFVPGLSCLDALMHCGVSGTRALLTAAR